MCPSSKATLGVLPTNAESLPCKGLPPERHGRKHMVYLILLKFRHTGKVKEMTVEAVFQG